METQQKISLIMQALQMREDGLNGMPGVLTMNGTNRELLIASLIKLLTDTI